MTKVIAICNQKGGVAKTTTSANLGVGLANQGKRVLLVDDDPQGDLTTSLGWPDNDNLPVTLATQLTKIINDEPLKPQDGILHHAEGVDLIPANIELSGLEMALVTTMSREVILRNYISQFNQGYDYIIIDCPPSLSTLTINALAAADSVIIPVQAQYLPVKGMTQLVRTVGKVKRQINPSLSIGGALLTLVDTRTNLAKATEDILRNQYSSVLKVYDTQIPMSVKAAEISTVGQSIFTYAPDSKVALAYAELTKGVLADG